MLVRKSASRRRQNVQVVFFFVLRYAIVGIALCAVHFSNESNVFFSSKFARKTNFYVRSKRVWVCIRSILEACTLTRAKIVGNQSDCNEKESMKKHQVKNLSISFWTFVAHFVVDATELRKKCQESRSNCSSHSFTCADKFSNGEKWKMWNVNTLLVPFNRRVVFHFRQEFLYSVFDRPVHAQMTLKLRWRCFLFQS